MTADLFSPECTESPEVKHFLIWLAVNGYTQIWQAYDQKIRELYKRNTGSSIDHMEELSRVMADPWFGVTE